MIKQNYNHCAIFTWGLGNELGLVQIRDPSPVIQKFQEIAKQEDPYRLTTLACVAMASFRKKLNKITDIIAVNTYLGWYYKHADKMKQILEKWIKIGGKRGLAVSEYGAGAGITQHEMNPVPKGNPRVAYGHWHPEEHQSKVHEITFGHITSCPQVWGSFVWNMFDFSVPFRDEGEIPGLNDKGLVTYDRKVRKDAFYFYKAFLNREPMVYITSKRFTERNKATTLVKVYSNCENVELFINGITIGKMKKYPMNVFMVDEIILKPGDNTIKAVGLIKNTWIEDNCVWILNIS